MDSQINQHKRLAQGQSIEAADDISLPDHVRNSDHKQSGATMKDHERGIGKHVKMRGDQHPAQAAPDHGPTDY